MKISFITDEFTQSLDEAIDFALENGLQGVELRSVDDRPLHSFTLSEVKEWKEKLDKAGLQVANLSSSFFKCEFEPEEIAVQLQRLEVLCDIADVLECEMIRGFAFFRKGEQPVPAGKLAEAFAPVIDALKRRGKTLVLESDPTVNTSNHKSLAQLISALNSVYCTAVYDPGNCMFDPLREIPYPDGYEAVRPFLRHVHIKDVVYEKGAPVCLAPGSGLVNFPLVLKRLKEDGYRGYLSLEPHYRKNSILTEEQMRTPSGTDFSRGGREAMYESVLALKKMLKDLCWFPVETR